MRRITNPVEIERQSFEIIDSELGSRIYPPLAESIVKRVIHTTADFEYADILHFGHNPVASFMKAVSEGHSIVSDTNMIKAGINKTALGRHGSTIACYMADKEVADIASESGRTRASVSMEKASRYPENSIFVIGNAPTALHALLDLYSNGIAHPSVIIGVPVGFVGAAESKELLSQHEIPYIITQGRKGGSTVAVAIVNAILYMMDDRK
jgi:precorrin-8X/cobalt-precorrin-8 methylmutase